MADQKKPEVEIVQVAHTVPTKDSPGKGFSLEMRIGNLDAPVNQIFAEQDIGGGKILYLPQGTNARQQIAAMRDEIILLNKLSELSDELDDIGDASNLSPEEKLRAGLGCVAKATRANYGLLHLTEPTEDVPQIIEMVKKNGKFIPIRDVNSQLPGYFSMLRKVSPGLSLDFDTAKEAVEAFKLPEDKLGFLKNYGLRSALKPDGNNIIGRIQLFNFPLPQDEELIKKQLSEIMRIASKGIKNYDSLVARALHKEGGVWTGFSEEENPNNNGFDPMEYGNSFVGAGSPIKVNTDTKEEKRDAWKFFKANSFIDGKFDDIRDRMSAIVLGFVENQPEYSGTPETIAKKRFETSVDFVKRMYPFRPELGISEEEHAKDVNSAISLMRLMTSLFMAYGNNIFELSKQKLIHAVGNDIDTDALENAIVMTTGLSRAIKYMREADNLKRISEIRGNNDIREMTSYLGDLIEVLNGRFSYYGVPLVDVRGKPSLLGRTVMYVSENINPQRKGAFGIDLAEQGINFEEMVQDSTSSPAIPIDSALSQMYADCVKITDKGLEIDYDAIKAIILIDQLVQPENESIYKRQFHKQLRALEEESRRKQ